MRLQVWLRQSRPCHMQPVILAWFASVNSIWASKLRARSGTRTLPRQTLVRAAMVPRIRVIPTRFGYPASRASDMAAAFADVTVPQTCSPQRLILTVTLSSGLRHNPNKAGSPAVATGCGVAAAGSAKRPAINRLTRIRLAIVLVVACFILTLPKSGRRGGHTFQYRPNRLVAAEQHHVPIVDRNAPGTGHHGGAA